MNRTANDPVSGGRLSVAGRVIDFDAAVLRDAHGNTIDLRPQVWGVLRELAMKSGRLVTKDELLASIWPGLVVTDGSITQAISDVRAALGDAGHQVIKTVPRRGYMLVCDQSAGPAEAAFDVRREPDVGAAASRPSIAVLPFGDPDGAPAGHQLARGLAQDLIAELARNVSLRVISHHSSFSFADGTTPLAEIGRRLGSRHLVDGTARRVGESLHVGVELIDSETGEVLWSQRYTAHTSDALARRDELVARIAGTVLSRVTHVHYRSALARPPRNLDVYAMTLRGIALRRIYSAASLREGRALLEQAIALDAEYGPAWTALALLNINDIFVRISGDRSFRDIPEAVAQAERAIALGVEDVDAHRAISQGRRMHWRFSESLASARRALDLGPSDESAWSNLADAEFSAGHPEAALIAAERAIDLNPIPTIWNLLQLAKALWGSGRLEEALPVATEGLVKHPAIWPNLLFRMCALHELGRRAEARADAAALIARFPRVQAIRMANLVDEQTGDLHSRILTAARASGIP